MDHTIPHPELYGVPDTTDDFHGMPWVVLGRSGLRVSKIGLGTWKMGYPETGDGSRSDGNTSLAILDRAYELGVTFWDTANRYNNASGNSERVIGAWLKSNPNARRDVVIATKICWGMDGVSPNHSRLGRLNIIESVKACLERLQTEYIDLLYFHGFDVDTPVEESLTTVEDLISKGSVRYFAVSNFSVDQLSLYCAAERGLSIRCRVIAIQNGYDIVNGEAKQQGVLEYCAGTHISFVPYSPLARGLLTGRYLDPKRAKSGDRLFDEGTLKRDASEERVGKVRQLAELAKEWNLEVSQLALAYTMTLPGMGPPIPSPSSVEQMDSNAAAGKVQLSDEQQSRVKGIVGPAAAGSRKVSPTSS